MQCRLVLTALNCSGCRGDGLGPEVDVVAKADAAVVGGAHEGIFNAYHLTTHGDAFPVGKQRPAIHRIALGRIELEPAQEAVGPGRGRRSPHLNGGDT
jgi:hypothetical protein